MELVKEQTGSFLEKEELKTIQDMNAEFSKLKIAIGDIEIQKQGIMLRIERLREDFSKHESMLIQKYGIDSVINLQTGEVTKKKDGTK